MCTECSGEPVFLNPPCGERVRHPVFPPLAKQHARLASWKASVRSALLINGASIIGRSLKGWARYCIQRAIRQRRMIKIRRGLDLPISGAREQTVHKGSDRKSTGLDSSHA